MAFYLLTNGHLHPYQFKYLEGAFEKARLERTQVHTEPRDFVSTLPENKKDFYAIDVMNKPVHSLSADSLLSEVQNEMKKYQIRHIPITHEHKIRGIISDRDLLKVEVSGTFYFLKAADVMTTVLVVAHEETPLAHVARVLLEEKISALPIIDKQHHLVGMISRSDILRAVVYNRLILR